MNFRFIDRKLERLYVEPNYTAGYGTNVVKAFRKVMGVIRAAHGEQDFYGMKSLHYEKLKGNRSHQRSMRLNDQFRLILEIEVANERTLVIISIEKHYE
jgi:proteic killer suppression protein